MAACGEPGEDADLYATVHAVGEEFCPALGIPEDPVSGNAHGLLGAYLVEQGLLAHGGAIAKFSGAQGHHLHRAGRVDVELEFAAGKLEGVWIVGQAVEIFETVLTF